MQQTLPERFRLSRQLSRRHPVSLHSIECEGDVGIFVVDKRPYGAFNAAMENKMVLGKIMAGGYHDTRKLPPDLLNEFDRVAHRPGYKRAARKVLAGWRSWSKARDQYGAIAAPVTLIYGDSDWSHQNERERTQKLPE